MKDCEKAGGFCMFLQSIVNILQELKQPVSGLTGLDLVEQTVHDLAPQVADLWIQDKEYNATEIIFTKLNNLTNFSSNLTGEENISGEISRYLASENNLKVGIKIAIDKSHQILEVFNTVLDTTKFPNQCSDAASLTMLQKAINKLGYAKKFSFPHMYNQKHLLHNFINAQANLLSKIVNCSLTKHADKESKRDLENLLEELLIYFPVFAFDDNVAVGGKYLMEPIDPNCLASNKIEACTCQCYKKRKLQAFRIYQKIHYLENLHIENLGNVIVWLLRNKLEGFKFRTIEWISRAHQEFGEEFIAFDRGLLKEITGVDMEVGLSEFITLLSTPADMFNKPLEIPGLNTFPKEVRHEVMKLFNYSHLIDREDQKLNQPDLKAKICSQENFAPSNLASYCRQAKKLPTIEKIMPLLRLAKHPDRRYRNIGNIRFTNLTQKVPQMPNLTLVPMCMHGRRSYIHWTANKKHPEDKGCDTEKTSKNNSCIPASNMLYQYPSCLEFEKRPSDIGLCSTFNGLDIRHTICT